MLNKTLLLFVLIMYTFIFESCSKKNYASLPAYQFKSTDGKPHYDDLHYWAAHPYKWDPSDSIPTPFKISTSIDSLVDVFFIHPTTLLDKEDARTNANIDDSVLNAKTDYVAILYQATAFNNGTRVFAPRYRQAHISQFFENNKLKAALAFNLAYEDVKKAFEYYLVHYNQNRPIIIASHSQGTIHAGRLIKEFFDGKKLKEKLICAYVIGMPTPANYFTTIKPCTDSTQTGCFVGWRTYKKNYIDTGYIAKENFKSIVCNPLTWKIDSTYAPNALNIGGILKNFNKLKPKVLDAQVHQNILWSNRPKFFGSIFIAQKNYHVGDINLFYANIRQNVSTRIANYFLQHKL
jgi:surface antigen